MVNSAYADAINAMYADDADVRSRTAMTGLVADVQLRWTDLTPRAMSTTSWWPTICSRRAEFMLSGDAEVMIEDGLVVVAHRSPTATRSTQRRSARRAVGGRGGRCTPGDRLPADPGRQPGVEARTVLCPYDFGGWCRGGSPAGSAVFTAWWTRTTRRCPTGCSRTAGRGRSPCRCAGRTRPLSARQQCALSRLRAGRASGHDLHADPSMARVAMATPMGALVDRSAGHRHLRR